MQVTAYENDAEPVLIVAVNSNEQQQAIDIDVFNGCVDSFSTVTTSATKKVDEGDSVFLTDGRGSVSVDAQSVTTFASQ